MIAIARALGTPMMPWQEYTALVAGEMVRSDHTGLWIPAYRSPGVSVPRQAGKTTVDVAGMLDRCWNWAVTLGAPQICAYTAHTGTAARVKWTKEIFPLWRKHPLIQAAGAKITAGMGNESVEFRETGSHILILSSSEGSGHSATLHRASLDEIWYDKDSSREAALVPTMQTVESAQSWWLSTAGTAASTMLNAKVQLGRRAVEEDTGRGVCYFEWGAPDGWDPTDDAAIPSFHPACGFTQTIDTIVATKQQYVDLDDYARAVGNVHPDVVGDAGAINSMLWDQRCDDGHPGPDDNDVHFGVAISEDRTTAGIAAADRHGNIELVDYRRDGTDWLAPYTNERTRRRPRARVGLAAGGPAETIADDLDNCDSDEQLSTRAYAAACVRFADDIVEGKLKIRTTPALNESAMGVHTHAVKDLYEWDRQRSTSDVVPIEAATVAYAVARQTRPPRSGVIYT